MIALGKEGVGDVIDTLLCTPYNGQIMTNSAPSGKQVAWPTVQAQILALCRQPHPPPLLPSLVFRFLVEDPSHCALAEGPVQPSGG
jgi:hypothetical protein